VPGLGGGICAVGGEQRGALVAPFSSINWRGGREATDTSRHASTLHNRVVETGSSSVCQMSSPTLSTGRRHGRRAVYVWSPSTYDGDTRTLPRPRLPPPSSCHHPLVSHADRRPPSGITAASLGAFTRPPFLRARCSMKATAPAGRNSLQTHPFSWSMVFERSRRSRLRGNPQGTYRYPPPPILSPVTLPTRNRRRHSDGSETTPSVTSDATPPTKERTSPPPLLK